MEGHTAMSTDVNDFRLRRLESRIDDHEARTRLLESGNAELHGEVTAMKDTLARVERMVGDIMKERYHNLIGFAVVIVSVVLSFVFQHLNLKVGP